MLHQSCGTEPLDGSTPVVSSDEKTQVSDLQGKPKERCRRERISCSAATSLRPEISKEPGGSDEPAAAEEYFGQERLKRHRKEMAGQVWIPEDWGQESLLKDWIDCTVFDRFLVPKGLVSAREALVEGRRPANTAPLRMGNQC